MANAVSRTFRSVAVIAGLSATLGTPPSSAATVEVKDALRIELGTAFFDAISDDVFKRELSKTERVRMDDVEDENGGAKVNASGISYIIYVRGFHLVQDGDGGQAGGALNAFLFHQKNLHFRRMSLCLFLDEKRANTNKVVRLSDIKSSDNIDLFIIKLPY